MIQPLVSRVPFAKIVTVLAIAFGVSLGLCGLNLVLSLNGARKAPGLNQLLGVASIVELAVMALSAVGLVLTCIAWVVLSVMDQFRKTDDGPPLLFGDKDDTDSSRKDSND